MTGFLIRLAKKLIIGLIMILIVASFTFFLVRMIPGDPVKSQYNQLILQGLSPTQAMNQVRVMYSFTPNEPLFDQYIHYLWHLLHFDLGQSITYVGIPVSHIVTAAAPWTIVLVLTGLVASFIVGVLAGVLAAIKRNSPVGSSLSVIGSLFHGIPPFVMGIFLAYIFATLWAIFPYGSPADPSISPGFSWAYISTLISHAVLPVATYVLSSYGGWLLTMKSSVITVLGDDFLLASEVRGMKPSIRVKYVAHNAILPLFTMFGLSIGFLFGGSLFIEQIFDYPGLGNMLINSIDSLDYPLMSGAFILITVAVIISNIVTDLLYSVIDPRIRR